MIDVFVVSVISGFYRTMSCYGKVWARDRMLSNFWGVVQYWRGSLEFTIKELI